MKTTSLKPSKKVYAGARNKFFVALLVIAILVVIQWLFPSAIYRVLYVISTPFTILRNNTGLESSYAITFFSSKASLAAENTQLKKDLSAISVKLLSMEALEAENQALENMVAAKQGGESVQTPTKMVFAAVILRPPFSPYDIFTISSGSESDISSGNPVFSDDGTPIGVTENIFPTSAKVLLFSSSGVLINVVIGDKKFQTSALGEGGGNFSFKVPTADAPKEGDAVYIPEFAPTAVGVVKNVSAEPTDTFAKVLFSFPENILEMSFVTVDTSRHFQVNTNEATTTNQ